MSLPKSEALHADIIEIATANIFTSSENDQDRRDTSYFLLTMLFEEKSLDFSNAGFYSQTHFKGILQNGKFAKGEVNFNWERVADIEWSSHIRVEIINENQPPTNILLGRLKRNNQL